MVKNRVKLLFFGDSITSQLFTTFQARREEERSGVHYEAVDGAVVGETSRDGLARLEESARSRPDVVILGFGMNDWRKGVEREEFKRNILRMTERFEEENARVIPLTFNPVTEGDPKASNRKVDSYCETLREAARLKKLKIADAHSLWKKELKKLPKGLRDEIHPDQGGLEIYYEALMRVLPRPQTTVLWQYNGREAKCNYNCPYCYYSWAPKSEDFFFGTTTQWRMAFLKSFGRQPLVFYLAFGEPMIGASFHDVVDMIGSEPNWQLRITSNLSVPLEKLLDSRVAKEGRLHVNGSFHPTMTTVDAFLGQLLTLRRHGIESPVVYVMYPPFLKRFEGDFEAFDREGFLVHVRRFRGYYKGKRYPQAYSDDERRFIARYCDAATIKYMLNERDVRGKPSYSGMHFLVVDCTGNVGYDSDIFVPYTKYRAILGNVLQDVKREVAESRMGQVLSQSPDLTFEQAVQRMLGAGIGATADRKTLLQAYQNVRSLRILSRHGLKPPAPVVLTFPMAGRLVAPIPELAQASSATGFVTVEHDPDGKVRRIRLFTKLGDLLFPQLAMGSR